MKNICLTFLIIVLLHFNASAQKVIRIYLDDNVPVTTVINEGKVFNAELKIKKYNKAKKLAVKIDNDKSSSFKHSLQLLTSHDSIVYNLEESINEPNTYSFDVNKLRSLIKKNSTLRILLLQEPKNPQMRIRSKSTLLMNIHFD